MKTQAEIEASICQGMSQFEREYIGRGPKAIRTHLIDDLDVVWLQGDLTAAEQQLVRSLPAEKGEGPAQTSSDPFARNRPAAQGGDGAGDHRHQGD